MAHREKKWWNMPFGINFRSGQYNLSKKNSRLLRIYLLDNTVQGSTDLGPIRSMRRFENFLDPPWSAFSKISLVRWPYRTNQLFSPWIPDTVIDWPLSNRATGNECIQHIERKCLQSYTINLRPDIGRFKTLFRKSVPLVKFSNFETIFLLCDFVGKNRLFRIEN